MHTPQAHSPTHPKNDCNANACTTPAGLAAIEAAFVAFVHRLQDGYVGGGAPAPTFFLTIAPHEKGQSAAILPAVAKLNAAGIKAVFLNATIDPSAGLPSGCGGHPGPTQHHAAFIRAHPVLAEEMGWTS